MSPIFTMKEAAAALRMPKNRLAQLADSMGCYAANGNRRATRRGKHGAAGVARSWLACAGLCLPLWLQSLSGKSRTSAPPPLTAPTFLVG